MSSIPPIGRGLPPSNDSDNQRAIAVANKLIAAVNALEESIKNNAPRQTIIDNYNTVVGLTNELASIPVTSPMGVAGLNIETCQLEVQTLGLELEIGGSTADEITMTEDLKTNLANLIQVLS